MEFVKAKIIKTSNFEAIILTDEDLPFSRISKIKKTSSGAVLFTEDEFYIIKSNLTGLETVMLWCSSATSENADATPKYLEWVG